MERTARYSLVLSATVAGIFALWGGWARRWISDDGLIVLRTVRNILAGNGPVFNVGERVEANTSTLWQYLIVAFSWLPGMELEDVAMWLALACTVIAAVTATWASGRLWQRAYGGAVLPIGVLVYLALPPARDFATSGLEWGLSLAWLAVWWALLVVWAGRTDAFVDYAADLKPEPDAHRACLRDIPARPVLWWLAFWCGLSWLIRPELALYGAVTGLALMVVYWGQWARMATIVAAAVPLPAGYQIFRMGYYGLLTPHTAVAKSASDSAWGTGAAYVWDCVHPYALWASFLLAVGCGIWCAGRLLRREQFIAALALVCGAFHVVYVIKVGGDFMHARMVLLPLFAMLLPVMALPATAVGMTAAGLVTVWAGIVVQRGHELGFDPLADEPVALEVVDEREFWTAVLRREPGNPPRYAEDFLGSSLMSDWAGALAAGEADRENTALVALVPVSWDPDVFTWEPRARLSGLDADVDLAQMPLTAYHLNLGMTSMNSELSVRILDQVGLATPLAARQPREPDGRIGHDKNLPLHWQLADSGVDIQRLPDAVDKQLVLQARAALRTPELTELLATSREPMSVQRFAKNMVWSVSKGRSLAVGEDPGVYLDSTTRERISSGEDVGLHGPPIFWPGN